MTPYDNKVSNMNKTESMSKAMFNALGLIQDSGSLLLNDNSTLSFSTEGIKLNGQDVKEGEFKTKADFSVVIKEGTLVDFGFATVKVCVEVEVCTEENGAEDALDPMDTTESNDLGYTSSPYGEVLLTPTIEMFNDVAQVATAATEQVQIVAEVQAVEAPVVLSIEERLSQMEQALKLSQDNLTSRDNQIALLTKELQDKPINKTTKETKAVTTAPDKNNGLRVGSMYVSKLGKK
jgi:hypothetical protein